MSDFARLRSLVRTIIRETRVKPNRGWEGYTRFADDENIEIDAGYPACYHTQYANVAGDLDELPEIDVGGFNVTVRRGVRYAGHDIDD